MQAGTHSRCVDAGRLGSMVTTQPFLGPGGLGVFKGVKGYPKRIAKTLPEAPAGCHGLHCSGCMRTAAGPCPTVSPAPIHSQHMGELAQ